MELFLLLLFILGWWMSHRPTTPPRQQWRFTFRAKRTPPLVVTADTDGDAVRQLWKAGICHTTVARLDPIP